MARTLGVLAIVAGLAGCVTTLRPLAATTANQQAWTVPIESIEFGREVLFGREGASLWGNRGSSASGNLERQPEDSATALHIHSAETFGMVITGHMTHQVEGKESAPEIGPGAFYIVPANAPHVSTCLPGTPCLVVFWESGPLTSKEVKPKASGGDFEAAAAQSLDALQFTTATSTVLAHARLWGEPTRPNSATAEKQPANSMSHTRSSTGDTHGVIILGTATITVKGDKESPPLAPGSYYEVPANRAFFSTCKDGPDCVFLQFHPDPYELNEG